MLLLWDLYWPALAAALVIGALAGHFAMRSADRRRRNLAFAIGAAATFATTFIAHGPVGAAERLRAEVESTARATLDYYEMTQVRAEIESDPVHRTLLLHGAADDFQRSELIRILGDVPGVAAVRWQDSGQGSRYPLPLLLETSLWSLAVFCLGLLLAYLVELRRRARAEWRW